MPQRNHGLLRDKRPLGAQHIIGPLKCGITIKDPLFSVMQDGNRKNSCNESIVVLRSISQINGLSMI